MHYPIFLDLRDKLVLVVGAGKVALRKTRGLLEAGASVTVVAPRHEAEFDNLEVRLIAREFRPADLEGAVLAFTAADVREVNRQVAIEAQRRGIPVNVADSPAECDFFVPARARRGDMQIAVSTGGRNPRLAAEVKRKLQRWLDREPG